MGLNKMGRAKNFKDRVGKTIGLEADEWNKIDDALKKFVRESGIHLNRAEFVRMFLIKNIKDYLKKKKSTAKQIDLEDLL